MDTQSLIEQNAEEWVRAVKKAEEKIKAEEYAKRAEEYAKIAEQNRKKQMEKYRRNAEQAELDRIKNEKDRILREAIERNRVINEQREKKRVEAGRVMHNLAKHKKYLRGPRFAHIITGNFAIFLGVPADTKMDDVEISYEIRKYGSSKGLKSEVIKTSYDYYYEITVDEKLSSLLNVEIGYVLTPATLLNYIHLLRGRWGVGGGGMW